MTVSRELRRKIKNATFEQLCQIGVEEDILCPSDDNLGIFTKEGLRKYILTELTARK